MNWTKPFRRQKVAPLAGPELYRSLIARYAPGRTFIDVGCMWGVNGGYAFHAASVGASKVVGLDVEPATAEFLARNETEGQPVRFVQGDLNDSGLPDRLGVFDVVFCTGVIYHVPNPVFTLEQLRRLCRGTLIVATPGFPEQSIKQAAFFLPHMDAESRQRLTYPTPNIKRGLDAEFLPEKDYGNWFWAFTPSCVRAMLKLVGFKEIDFHHYGRLICAVSEVSNVASDDATRST